MFSNLPWSGIGLTSCSLNAASRLFAAAVIIKIWDEMPASKKDETVDRKRTLIETKEKRSSLQSRPSARGYGRSGELSEPSLGDASDKSQAN